MYADSDFEYLEITPAGQLQIKPRPPKRSNTRRTRRRNGMGYLSSPPARQRMIATDYGYTVPLIKLHGTWNLGDMLSSASIGNLFTIYSAIEGRQHVRHAN